MDDAQFGGAVPALTPLRIQKNSLGSFGFGNGQNGLFGLKGNAALAGTALDDAVFGKLLLPAANRQDQWIYGRFSTQVFLIFVLINWQQVKTVILLQQVNPLSIIFYQTVVICFA